MTMTLEGKIVRLSDKIAYINSDIDDAILAGILKEKGIALMHTLHFASYLTSGYHPFLHYD